MNKIITILIVFLLASCGKKTSTVSTELIELDFKFNIEIDYHADIGISLIEDNDCAILSYTKHSLVDINDHIKRNSNYSDSNFEIDTIQGLVVTTTRNVNDSSFNVDIFDVNNIVNSKYKPSIGTGTDFLLLSIGTSSYNECALATTKSRSELIHRIKEFKILN